MTREDVVASVEETGEETAAQIPPEEVVTEAAVEVLEEVEVVAVATAVGGVVEAAEVEVEIMDAVEDVAAVVTEDIDLFLSWHKRYIIAYPLSRYHLTLPYMHRSHRVITITTNN
jgi:hypothetical protein